MLILVLCLIQASATMNKRLNEIIKHTKKESKKMKNKYNNISQTKITSHVYVSPTNFAKALKDLNYN